MRIDSDSNLIEVSLASGIGRHIIAWSLFSLSAMWTLQLYRGGGTSGLLSEVHRSLGNYATGAGFAVSVVLLVALFRREAKIVGGLMFSAFAGVTGIVGALNGHADVGMMFLASVLPLGFAVALMAKAGMGR